MVVRRLVGGDPDLAADIAQEVWIQIFRALPSYRGDSQFSTWAHRIAVNRTLNALRKTRRLATIETEVKEDSASVDPDHDRTFLAQSIEEAAAKLSLVTPSGGGRFHLLDTIRYFATNKLTVIANGVDIDEYAPAFYKGAAAHDASDRIIYNPTTGALLYDSNGSATGGAVKFAMLANSLALTHLDFFVV